MVADFLRTSETFLRPQIKVSAKYVNEIHGKCMKHPFLQSPSQTHEDYQERIPNELLCNFIFYARRMFLGPFLSVAIILSASDYTELIESR